MGLDPLELTVCHNVDTISPFEKRDAYTVTCTCGRSWEIEGHEMEKITQQAKAAFKKEKTPWSKVPDGPDGFVIQGGDSIMMGQSIRKKDK